jgi:hypothetical protein
MSIESSIENMIKEAIARGEFDNLSGAGKPLDLDAYFNTPEDLRMAFSMLKSNDFVPEEVEMLKEIENLRETLKASTDSDEKERLQAKINERSLAVRLLIERRARRR